MTHPAATTCVICTGERQAYVGFLCLGHLERLGAMLREVEDQAAMLDAVPSMAIRTGSGGGSLASERSPARLDVLVHRDPRSRQAGTRPVGPACPTCWHDTCTDIRAWLDAYDAKAVDALSIIDVLHSWARLVREDRDLTPPEMVTISSERDLLSRQLAWLAEQPFIDEVYVDVRQLLSQLKGVNSTAEERPVGRCYLPAEEGACGGSIRRAAGTGAPWFTLTDRCVRKDIETADGHAYCERCGAIWEGPRLATLSYEMEKQKREEARPRTEDGGQMLTAEELVAQGYVSSVSNVRVRAHRLGITAVHGHYDPAPFQERMAG